MRSWCHEFTVHRTQSLGVSSKGTLGVFASLWPGPVHNDALAVSEFRNLMIVSFLRLFLQLIYMVAAWRQSSTVCCYPTQHGPITVLYGTAWLLLGGMMAGWLLWKLSYESYMEQCLIKVQIWSSTRRSKSTPFNIETVSQRPKNGRTRSCFLAAY